MKLFKKNNNYYALKQNSKYYSVESDGGSSIGITREVSSQGVYQMPSTNFSFSLPSNATDIGAYAMYNAFYGCTGITSVDLSNLTTISGGAALYNAFHGCTGITSLNLSSLTTISGSQAMYSTFYGCTSITSVNLSSLTTIEGYFALNYAFQRCTNLTSVDFSNLQIIGKNSSSTDYGQFSYCFNSCYNLTSISFPKLEKIYCTAGNTTAYGTFANNDGIQKLYFPKLDTITYGEGASSTDQVACKYVFYGCSALTEIHFGAANQAAIQASPGYSTLWGRGAGRATVYFDL